MIKLFVCDEEVEKLLAEAQILLNQAIDEAIINIDNSLSNSGQIDSELIDELLDERLEYKKMKLKYASNQ